MLTISRLPFEEVYLQPSGDVGLTGIMLESPEFQRVKRSKIVVFPQKKSSIWEDVVRARKAGKPVIAADSLANFNAVS